MRVGPFVVWNRRCYDAIGPAGDDLKGASAAVTDPSKLQRLSVLAWTPTWRAEHVARLAPVQPDPATVVLHLAPSIQKTRYSIRGFNFATRTGVSR